jgi:hypothetical protein
VQDKLCGTQVIPGSDGSRRTFLHGVALHRRTKSSSTVASAPGPTGNRCCPYGNSGSGKYCTVDCKHEALGGGNELVTKLLSQDFKSTHTRDRFCIDCCTSFGASFCSHHRNHKVLSLVNKDGVYYICFDGDEDWAYFFDSVDTKKAIEGGRVRRMMLLKAAPLPKNRCPCGRAVEKTHCSATCLVRNYSICASEYWCLSGQLTVWTFYPCRPGIGENHAML